LLKISNLQKEPKIQKKNIKDIASMGIIAMTGEIKIN